MFTDSPITAALPDFDTCYQAVLQEDVRFNGVFFTGVKTTGIFCRPSCKARKPRPENVRFFESSKAALSAGFRPCKMCKPLQTAFATPAPIQRLIAQVQADPSKRLKDADLRQLGFEPATLRRFFIKHHGMTFQAYQRMLRLNSALDMLKDGRQVAASALEAGFESLSGFGSAFAAVYGVSPKQSKGLSMLLMHRFETPLGTMLAASSAKGICLLEFTDRKGLENELIRLAKRHNAQVVQGINPLLQQLQAELAEYFEGARQRFEVPLDVSHGTPFQQQVWQCLLQIPYGDTRSYAQQAEAIGRKSSVRAVANANGCNQIAIVIPCHRVIGSDGSLTGYAGGLERKAWLLALEKRQASLLSSIHPIESR